MLLPNGELHIHLLRPVSSSLIDSSTLNTQELQRAAAFKFQQDKDLYLSAHVFLRWVLSQYTKTAPGDWQFQQNSYGKPSLSNNGYDWLEFNLAHTQGLIACAVAYKRAVGVDVEKYRSIDDLPSFCHFTFSPLEAKAILASDPNLQEQYFFSYWTLKEAYIKARGMGLSLPLQQFSFVPTIYQTWQLHYHEQFPDDGNEWHCGTLRVGHHQLAYCAPISDTPLSAVRIHQHQASLLTTPTNSPLYVNITE